MSGHFGDALIAEILKTRRTLALWLVFVLPAAPVGLQFLNFFHRGEYLVGEVDSWLWMGQSVMVMWATLLMPLFVALETSVLAGVEHGSQGWKHLFSLPVRRGTIYGAKMLLAVILVAAANAMLYVWVVAAGLGLSVLRPDLGFTDVPWVELLAFVGVSFFGSWLVIAIHAWLSLRWPSMILNVGVAVMAVFGSLAASGAEWSRFWPWMVSGNLENLLFKELLDRGSLQLTPEVMSPLLAGSVGGLIVFLAARSHLARRDVI